ncbi:MAG: hypothetical protein A2Y33_04405 [Spirochaetes bacterium GWF1_51_8]|nr:MAG: hypothetical protein A2Y33_04405 [Spirochaetes bacterium GWF1_51_8]
MQKSLVGQKHPSALLQKLLNEDFQGRTLVFSGVPGCGKFTAGILFAEKILGKDPFLSPDFLFYRNDDFALKTRYFIRNTANEKLHELVKRYFRYFLGRISQAVFLGEIPDKLKEKKIDIASIREELETGILNGGLIQRLGSDTAFAEKLQKISDELSKKQKIPIDFIREAIEFHSRKSSGNRRITIIGDFENATVQAQNSALKLFEEPSPTSLIIITVSDIGQVLPTILSRSIVIKFDELSPQSVKTIFFENPGNYRSTLDLMNDEVYQFGTKRRASVREFFTKVAPQVQFGFEVFQFIDRVCDNSAPGMEIQLLEEIANYFRNLHLLRQQILHNIEIKNFIDIEYQDISETLIRKTTTAEISELSAEIETVWKKVKYGNVSPQAVFPALLLNISRWYQKKIK